MTEDSECGPCRRELRIDMRRRSMRFAECAAVNDPASDFLADCSNDVISCLGVSRIQMSGLWQTIPFSGLFGGCSCVQQEIKGTASHTNSHIHSIFFFDVRESRGSLE